MLYKKRKLYKENYAQFPRVLCSYCSLLLYSHSVKWVIKTLPILFNHRTINVITNPRNESKIDGCKSNHNNRSCYALAEIPHFHMQNESISLPSIYTPV